jgi:methylenetetrahydrofolate dehydrogenase (NADP+)/methenyltetrahydrofolate cyclohydrolase
MQKISGIEIAKKIIDELKTKSKPEKILAAVLVGGNPASISFLNQKEKIAKELGVDFRIYKFLESIKNDDLRQEVNKIALLKKVGGVIVQLPLPEYLNKYYILNVIPREKDIDVLGERALGAFYTGRNPILPPSVGVVEEIVHATGYMLHAAKVAVVGLGFLIGKPIATWLTGKTKEIYLLDEGSNLEILKQADLVITGVGKPGLIKPEMLKERAGVIDFGYSLDENGKIRGDFNDGQLSNVKCQLLFYTPTPGGTGPILVAKLFENFYNLN